MALEDFSCPQPGQCYCLRAERESGRGYSIYMSGKGRLKPEALVCTWDILSFS